MPIKVFCWFNTIEYDTDDDGIIIDSVKVDYFNYIEEYGIWVDWPTLFPVGTEVYFNNPLEFGNKEFCMVIERYRVEEDGKIICFLNDSESGHQLCVHGKRDDVINGMKKIGLVHFYGYTR